MQARLPSLSQFATRLQGRAAFGVGGGGAQQFFDAARSGIEGRVTVLVEGEQIQNDDAPQALNTLAQFPANTLARVGSFARLIESMFVDVAVTGTLPPNQTPDSMRSLLIGMSYVQPEIGGVPQSQIPLAAMIDTRKVDRQFGFKARLSAGDAQSLAFRWRSDSLLLIPASPGPPNEYQVHLFLMPVFSALPKQNKNARLAA